MKIEDILDNEWKDVDRVYNLPGLGQDVWDYYELAGTTGLREQHLLAHSLIILKKAIKETYNATDEDFNFEDFEDCLFQSEIESVDGNDLRDRG